MCDLLASVAVDDIPLCDSHASRTVDARIIAQVAEIHVTALHGVTGFCQYDAKLPR